MIAANNKKNYEIITLMIFHGYSLWMEKNKFMNPAKLRELVNNLGW